MLAVVRRMFVWCPPLQDAAQTVTMHHLVDGRHVARATMPLAWVPNTDPAEHDLA